MQVPTDSNIIRVPDVAKMFEVNEYTVRAWAKRGLLPGHRIGNQWFFHLGAIDKFFELKEEEIKERG